MTIWRSICATLCAAFLATQWVSPAAAQQPQEGKVLLTMVIGVVDVDRIIREATAAQDIRVQVRKYRDEFQADIQKEEEQLRTANQELARQRTILSAEAFAEERRKFEQRVVDMQRKAQARNREFALVRREAERELQGGVNEAVAWVAKQHSFTLILNKKAVALFAEPLNVTSLVLGRLNEQFPRYKVKFPEAEQ